MSHARRTLRIPDAISRSFGPDGAPLWYGGALQTENGQDVPVMPREEGSGEQDPTAGFLDKPESVSPSGEHPDKALRRAR